MNLIVRLLLDLGILRRAEREDPKIKSRPTAKKKLTKKEVFENADYTRDPIQAPRRFIEDDDNIISLRQLLPIVIIGVVVMGLLVWASSVFVWSGETPEKKLRAEWQEKTHAMSCMNLKKIIEEDPSNLPSVAWQFSFWEYMSSQKVYPSPRPVNQCFHETGYLLKDINRCATLGAFVGCNTYQFARDEKTKTITFPHDWFFIDSMTDVKFTDPNSFIANYYPELFDWHGVINGTG